MISKTRWLNSSSFSSNNCYKYQKTLVWWFKEREACKSNYWVSFHRSTFLIYSCFWQMNSKTNCIRSSHCIFLRSSIKSSRTLNLIKSSIQSKYSRMPSTNSMLKRNHVKNTRSLFVRWDTVNLGFILQLRSTMERWLRILTYISQTLMLMTFPSPLVSS